MKITNHAELRMKQRGIKVDVVKFLEYFLPSAYENQSQKIFLSKKTAISLARKFRKLANLLEKHSGVELLFDPTGSSLITAYRKSTRR